MDILTIVKLSLAGIAFLASGVLFFLDFRKKKAFSVSKAAYICVAAAAIGFAGFTGFRLLQNNRASTRQNYMACLLMDMQDYTQARSQAEQAYDRTGDSQSANLILLSLCWQGRYEVCADEARSYLKGHTNEMASRIYDLCVDARDGTPIRDSQLILMLNQVRESLKLSQEDKQYISSLVDVQQAISLDFSIDSVQTDLLIISGKNDSLSLKSQAQAALCQGDTAQALALTEKIVQTDPTVANAAALALAAAQNTVADDSDWEAQQLQEQLHAAYERDNELRSGFSEDLSAGQLLRLQEQIEAQQEQIRELEIQLSSLPARRAINYLENASGLFGRKEPATLLALSKLYYQAGEDETSEALLAEFLTGTEEFGSLSSERSLLIDAYNQAGTADDTAVSLAAEDLFVSLTQGLSSTDSFYNSYRADRESFADYLQNIIDKLRSGILINRVNTDAYPQVDVYVSLSREKEDGSLYDKSDFRITDLDAAISDFTVIQPESDESAPLELSICLVVDHSGSMEGSNLQGAKQAVTEFLRTVPDNVHVGLVGFESSAELLCPLSEPAAVTRALNTLYATGGTNMASGLEIAGDVLQNAAGSKTIILLSDGVDSSDPAHLEEVLVDLEKQNIAVYSVGFGNAESSYMSSISQRTGGKFLRAEEAGGLTEIYQQVSRYLLNNYILRFTVVADPEEYSRYLQVRLFDNAYDEANYSVGVPEEQLLAEETLEPLSDFYQQIGGSYRPEHEAGD